ncbi:hypothetical protein [Thalassomonas sp. RHCl1]|uniref:hypothetical protein n=1 Tax=Thalassomonas sp. RHCl1 TaxID=2995320 RepID=UPI00248D2072|nr:hypothetical protein [Thalassomonas sp. RHCl1]
MTIVKTKIKPRLLLTSIASVVFLVSCSVAPEHHVRTGEDPRYQDTDVAFRTTYYFRVFDYCQSSNEPTAQHYPKTSGLYRFKMTGKSSTFKNKVKFESGILKSWELDPLGASVLYDKEIGRHRFVSENETQNEAKQKKAWQDYKELQKEYLALSGDNKNSQELDLNNNLTAALNATINPTSAIDNGSLTSNMDMAFAKNKTEVLDKLNENLITTIKTAITQKQTELLSENSQKAQDTLNSVSRLWLLNSIKTKLKHNINTKVNSTSLPENIFDNKDNAKEAWDNMIKSLTTKVKFGDAEKHLHTAELIEKYKAINSLGNIQTETVTIDNKDKLIAQLLAEGYYSQLNNMALKHLTGEFESLFIELNNQFKLKEINGEEKTTPINDEIRTKIKEQLTLEIESLFAFSSMLATRAENTPLDVNFEALPEATGVYAKINKKNIAKQLEESTKILIASAVQHVHYPESGPLSATLTSLKNAMNNKLAIATGTSVMSNASGDTKILSQNEEIRCGKANKRKGFQILGPEGWRTFNQDERLVMAMYSDNSPITNVLKELSQQVLNAHQSNEPNLLPIVKAELRLSKAQQQLTTEKNNLLTAKPEEKLNALCELVDKVTEKLQTENESTPIKLSNCKGD